MRKQLWVIDSFEVKFLLSSRKLTAVVLSDYYGISFIFSQIVLVNLKLLIFVGFDC